ncbi:MAG: hypothetical protein MUD12_06145 [Spirochaetes bacterium]|nr:hypothetical protein [Spirochaetota bacterium]
MMRKKIKVIFIIFSALFIISCASIPPLATVSSGQKSVDLKLNESRRSLKEFLTIKKAVISPDKRHLLIVTTDGNYVLFNGAMGLITDDRPKCESLDMMKTPYFKLNGPNYHNNIQMTSPDKRYNVAITGTRKGNAPVAGQDSVNAIITDMQITDGAGGKSMSFSRPFLWLFGRSMLIIGSTDGRGSGWTSFISLPGFQEVKRHQASITLGIGEWNNYYVSFSSDSANDILVKHNGRLVAFYEFRTGKHLGSIMLCGRDKWFAVSSSGEYDGTEDMFDSFYWNLENESVPVNKFDRSFRNKNLLAQLFGLRKDRATEASRIDLAGQLAGRVREVKGSEIIVSSGRAAETMMMGDKIFIIIDGKKAVLEVKFPMQTIAKCVLSGAGAAFQGKITPGMPVFK